MTSKHTTPKKTPSRQSKPDGLQRRTTKLVDQNEVVPVKWEPAPYQKQASKFLQDNPASALFLDPGLRKTSITLHAFARLKKKGLVDKALIIAPLRVCYSVWPKEVQKWKDFGHLRVEILHGPKKDQAVARDADIYLINPEGLDWFLGVTKTRQGKKTIITYDIERLKRLNPDTLIIDEISKFKRASSDRFKVIKPFLPGFLRRWGLTGSPAPNGLLDLFGIMYVIDLGHSLGEYISHYRAAYFKPTGYGGYTWVLQPGAKEAIYERIAEKVFRLADSDYVKLPELIVNKIKVVLPPKARKIYDDLEEELIAELAGNTVTAANAAVASGKCRQVANGGLYLTQAVDGDGRKQGKREWVDVHTAKLEAVMELLDELNGSPAIIAYDFEHDLARLLKALGKNTPIIGGGISAKKSDQIVDAWNRGEVEKLLGHPAAMAHGLNMQDGNAQHIILHSLIWDFELYDQLIRRLRRSGNKASKVFVHLIVAEDTVDEAICAALQRKNRDQNHLLNAMKDYTRLRKRRRTS